jgi:hypothetical protein
MLHLPLSGEGFGTVEDRESIYDLEDRIIEAVAGVGGEHDGHDFGQSESVLFTYGPDANALLDAIRGCLVDFQMPPGVYVIKRFGGVDDPDALEERIDLT